MFQKTAIQFDKFKVKVLYYIINYTLNLFKFIITMTNQYSMKLIAFLTCAVLITIICLFKSYNLPYMDLIHIVYMYVLYVR